MKNKITKKILLFTLVGSMLLPANVFASTETTPATAYEEAANEDEVNPRADDIDWQYSVRNGVLYKRLYNYTTNKPLSDWQIVT